MSEDASWEVGLARRIFMNERELRAGWRFLIYVAVALLLLSAFGLAAVRLHAPLPAKGVPATPLALLDSEILNLIGFLGAAVLMGKFEHRSFGVYGLPARGALRKNFWVGIIWGFVMISATMLLIHAWGGFTLGKIDLGSAAIFRYAAVWAGVFLAVGIAENFTICGYTHFTLARGIRFWPAAILLSVVFGSLHLNNSGEGLAGALNVFVIGMFFFLTLRRTGNLWFSVGLHLAWDWGETYFYSVPDSGLVSPHHLYASSFHGATWLTGGTIGPEGSVMSFVVIGAAALLFALLYRAPRRSPEAPGAEVAQQIPT